MSRRRPRRPAADPFGVLGLPPSPDLTDGDVRAAWRRVASDTHPDREDGGDPAGFAAAAAAYTALRTRFGRGEAMADLGLPTPSARESPARRPATPQRAAPPRQPAAPGPPAPAWPRALARPGPRALARLAWRVRSGRPLRLALRILAAGAASVAAVAAAGPHPAAPALVTGIVTWLVLTARRDLAPPG